jgi:asparagine synthase (glutamine-hydrolysing)
MCGILATINQDVSLAQIALKNMEHRGPDAVGTFAYKNLCLGHLRLSIQDLSAAADQPMHNLDERYTIIFNGEIYNHWELRKQELETYIFKTKSDTETILALYIKYGEECLNMLNGIFAFVIFDKVRETLFVARDQFGVKPLYYSLSNSSFVCASELKALLPYVDTNEIDIHAIQDYLTFMWCPGEGTPLKTVSKLLPGSYLSIDLNDLSKTQNVRYYQLKFPNKITDVRPLEVWVDELELKLIAAVKRQLLSDAPIGFFLSGGLDSSLLVAIARKLLPDHRLKCYTIDSGESKDGFSNDLFYARKVAKHLNVDLVEIKVDSSLVGMFDQIIWHLDEPESDPAPFNAFKIAEAARKDGIKVLIGGTAGDDIFSGYRRHQALLVDKYFDNIPMFLRKLIKTTIQSITSKKPFIRRLKKLTKSIDKTKIERLVGYFEWQNFDFVKSIFVTKYKNKLIKENKYFKSLLEDVKSVESDLNKLLYLEIYTFLIDHNLNYTDKAGMANSVEIRVPYLDIDLVEFSTTIPPRFKMNGKQTKYILRKVAEKYLPNDVIYRSKAGFGVPIESWIRQDLDAFVVKELSKESINKSDIFDHERVSEIVTQNREGKINASYNIWSLLAMQSWIKQFKKPS